MTGLVSRSLGAAEYRRCLAAAGFTVESEYEDEGENHYVRCGQGPGAAMRGRAATQIRRVLSTNRSTSLSAYSIKPLAPIRC
jgi:hypothetical protein